MHIFYSNTLGWMRFSDFYPAPSRSQINRKKMRILIPIEAHVLA